MLSVPRQVVRHIPRALREGLGGVFGSDCAACGRRSIASRARAIPDELVRAWQLPPDWARHFEEREGLYCSACGCSRRTQQLAAAVVDALATRLGRSGSLAALCDSPAFHALSVAEINSCGSIHQFLKRHPRLAYSEYGSTKRRSEDLMALSYGDASFDLVLTSDTLEHVPDLWRAFAEIRRVLKPDGQHVFTVPVVRGRATRTRAVVEGGVVRHLLPPSYHGAPGQETEDRLVFHELGDDFEDRLKGEGWNVRVLRDGDNPALVAYVTTPRP